MDARYPIRKAQLLEECQVAPEVFEQVLPRLRTLLAPFVDTLQGQAPRAHAQTYVRGLLSDVERKNVESIAYHFGQDRLGLQGLALIIVSRTASCCHWNQVPDPPRLSPFFRRPPGKVNLG